jgi:hypothetical protein
VAALAFTLCPAAASAQSVQGQGEISNGPGISPSHISVNAGIDDSGCVYGKMTWIGDNTQTPPYPPGTGGPSDPFIMEVISIEFFGNSAYVEGVVVSSPGGKANGTGELFVFTDNSGTGEPDEINGEPIVAGNIKVND